MDDARGVDVRDVWPDRWETETDRLNREECRKALEAWRADAVSRSLEPGPPGGKTNDA